MGRVIYFLFIVVLSVALQVPALMLADEREEGDLEDPARRQAKRSAHRVTHGSHALPQSEADQAITNQSETTAPGAMTGGGAAALAAPQQPTMDGSSEQSNEQQIPMPSLAQQLPRLPEWLRVATQTERVCDALARHVPEFASGALRLVTCEVRRPRFKEDQVRWIVTYLLMIEGPVPRQQYVVAVEGALIPPGEPEPPVTPEQTAAGAAFGADTWCCYVPELRMEFQMAPPEKTLPAVPLLTDPQAARALLEQSLRARAPDYDTLRLQASTPEVMRHHPGKRSTIRYHLEYPADLAGLAASRGWPELAIAKVYRGDKGQIAYDGMRALWDSPLARGDIVSIAEPFGYLPEQKTLIQGPVRGELSLNELLNSALTSGAPEAMATLADYVRKTAVGVAALHHSEVHADTTVTWQDVFAEIREEVTELSPAVPHFVAAAMPVLARLEAYAAACPADPPVPSHGSFRPRQVLLSEGQVGFIDFDSFCQAEPAMDLALFRAEIKDNEHKALTPARDGKVFLARLAQLDAIGDAFLAQYEALSSVSRQRVALWEALYLCNYVVTCWSKLAGKGDNELAGDRLSRRIIMLEHHLRLNGLFGA